MGSQLADVLAHSRALIAKASLTITQYVLHAIKTARAIVIFI